MNGATLSLTLPSTPPSSTWYVGVQNLNSTPLNIIPSGSALINGAPGSGALHPLQQFQVMQISTDGVNYFSSPALTAGANITLTPAGNGTGIIISGTGSGGGTVTGVTASSPLASSGGAAPNIIINSSTGSGPVVLGTSPAISSPTIFLPTLSGAGVVTTGSLVPSTTGTIVANALAAGTYSTALTLSNASNSFTGSGAGLTGTASGLSIGGNAATATTAAQAANATALNGTYGIPVAADTGGTTLTVTSATFAPAAPPNGGPQAVTVNIVPCGGAQNGCALVILTAYIQGNGEICAMSFSTTGTGGALNQSLFLSAAASAAVNLQSSATFFVQGLPTGSTKFTATYEADGPSPCLFNNPTITVIPY